jgi:arginine decarboxylase
MAATQYDVLAAKSASSVIEQVAKTYGVDDWGFGYFFINEHGHLAVAPSQDRGRSIDVKAVVDELIGQQHSTPFLLRFPQILDDRLEALHNAFRKAVDEFEYEGRHLGVYPVKVNQKSEVIQRLVSTGRRFQYGLEVGSKAELITALAMPLAEDSLIVCNGLKDDLFLRSAILAEKAGRKTIIVVEDTADMKLSLELGEKLGVAPHMGIRVKLYSRGSGKWEESGGEFAKFGMSTIALVQTLEILRKQGQAKALKMLHFHIGSQITNIKSAKQAVKEAARVYAKVREMGFEVEYLNVGGGLGVDYDGSKTASEFSVNYSVQEFVNDIVYVIKEVCDGEGVPHPTIITESGRAMVSYHSLLVADVKKVIAPGRSSLFSIDTIASESEPVQEMIDLAREINSKNFREYYHDAIQHREDLNSLFDLGYLDLEEKAKGEWLFWGICRQAAKLSRSLKPRPEEFDNLDKLLSSKYICNFSMFQSMPDFWAFDQLFPIMPIHRLNELPTERGVLCDITCDSDGSVDKFVDIKDVKEALELHSTHEDEPYYLGFLLLGAYQETLGDLHNLFGVVTEVNVVVGPNGRPLLNKIIRGDSVREVIEYTGHDTDELREVLAKRLSERKELGLISDDDEHEVLATVSRVLDDYTYLA